MRSGGNHLAQTESMVAIALPPDAATRIRFGVSCLWEVVTSLRVLHGRGDHPVHRRWADRNRPGPGGLLARLVPPAGGYAPDFLTPPPAGLTADLDAELSVLRQTDHDVVRAHLALLAGDPAPGLAEDPDRGLARLCDEIAAYWASSIAPDWPRMHGLLDADVRRRAHRLATDGAAAVLNDLHDRVRWTGGTLLVDQRHCTASDVPDGSGLVLIPSVFAWPAVLTVSAWGTPQLAYPAAGVATLTETPAAPPDALSALLGAGRARILSELHVPRSTTGLARRTGLTAGGVSQHLRVLRAAGLVTTHREGRSLLNSRTAAAETLLAAAPSPVRRLL
ncbi:ArsR family transcriptional regulator [Actinoplanes sp. SE50]|nr:putative transcriptional regulator, ArsR family [Actinoplanes sp. SE50/110]ATO86785.1 ArsR family transcriptional regulator [Actinoplanes sp. SE50]